MVTHLSTRQTQLSYFSRLLPGQVWRGAKILDFGGNVGGFLAGAGDEIDHDDYWCLDLTKGAIEQGRARFPRAHFVHYDRYSSYFNPDGVRNHPLPDLELKFDVIVAFSVFTHTHQKEMLDLVNQLRRMLKPHGALAFTFCDPGYDRSLTNPELPSGTEVRKMLEWERAANPSLEIDGMVEAACKSNWCVLIDDQLHLEPSNEICQQEREGKPGEDYCSYFSVDYMGSLFPGATLHAPVSPEWQHCCILRNA